MRRHALFLAAVLLPAHLAAQEPAPAAPPTVGMTELPCPPPQPGEWAGSDTVLHSDWAWLCRYRAANAAAAVQPPPVAVFLGDSITERWAELDPAFFATGFVGRGISGQTSPQMLVRFMADVVALHPKVVHIMAGTNDVAGNTGPSTPEDFRNNIRAMTAIARAHGIRVVIGSILPADHFDWRKGLAPAQQIAALNAWLADYARAEGLVYADYYSALADPGGALPERFSKDGVHPEMAGYAVMEPIARQAIAQALARADKSGS